MEMQISMAPLDLGVLSSFQLGPDDPSFQSANDVLAESRPVQLNEMLDLVKSDWAFQATNWFTQSVELDYCLG